MFVTPVNIVLWYEQTGGIQEWGAEEVMYLDLREGAIRIMGKNAQEEALLFVCCTRYYD